MKSLILPIRFRKPVNRIAAPTEEFLKKVAAVALSSDEPLEASCLEVYPIANPRDFPPGPLASDVLSLTIDHDDLSLLIIDVGGPNESEVLQPRFVIALAAMISSVRKRLTDIQIILTLPSRLDDEDEFAPMLETVFRENNVIRFFYDDTSVESHLCSEQVYSEKKLLVESWLAVAMTSPKKLLERKMVCHIGNYVIPDLNKNVHDYYEGDFATKEIYEIACKLISELLETNPHMKVLFDDRVSHWFARPINNALNYFDDQIEAIRFSDLDDELPLDDVGLVLFPICRTGRSAQDVLEKIGFGGQGGEPTVVTFLDVGPEENIVDDLRQIELRDGEVSVPVKVIAWLGDRANRLSSLWNGLEVTPLPTSEIDLAGMLPSDSMWAMIYEAGLEDETDVPSYRPSLGRIPSFTKLIDLNGPLFAAKINKTLGRIFGPDVGRNFAFFHPDEPTANKLAACVWDLADWDSVSMKSRLIELAEHITDAPTLLDRAQAESAELGDYAKKKIEELRFVTRNASAGSYLPFRIVLLAEFQASGGRMRGLINLAGMLGWEILGSISLARMYQAMPDHNRYDHFYYQFGYGAESLSLE